jgi:hypothetical protein
VNGDDDAMSVMKKEAFNRTSQFFIFFLSE